MAHWSLLGPLLQCLALSLCATLASSSLVSRLSRASSLRLGFNEGCDLARGRWVQAPKPALYTGFTCPYIRASQNCQRNGRLLTKYLNWRWEPEQPGCRLHRFNPRYFLKRKQNKVIGMVGDSFTANFEDALRCSLDAVSPTNSTVFKLGRRRVHGYRVAEFNVTVLHLPSVFLVRAEAPEGASSNKRWIVHLDRPDPGWAHVLDYTHVLLFSTGHWFMNARAWMREYYAGGKLQPRVSRETAMRIALATVRDYILSRNYSGSPVFLTYSPFHYHQAYNTSAHVSCVGAQGPFNSSQMAVAEQASDSLRLRTVQLSVFRRGVAGFEKSFVPLRALWLFRIMDVTRLSLFRPDAHIQKWGNGPMADCSHWCTPGLPDTWVDYFYTLLVH